MGTLLAEMDCNAAGEGIPEHERPDLPRGNRRLPARRRSAMPFCIYESHGFLTEKGTLEFAMAYMVGWQDLDKKLFRVSHRGMFDLVAVWAGIFAIAVIVGRLAGRDSVGMILQVAGILGIAILQNGLASLSHHAVHGHLSPGRRLNDSLFRWLLSAPMGQNCLTLRREHLDHHSRYGMPADPERFYYDLNIGGRNTAFRLATWTILILLGYVIVGELRRVFSGSRSGSSERDGLERREYTFVLPAQILLFGVYWGLTGTFYGYFVFWLLPLVTIGAGLNALRATLEHADPNPNRNLNRSFVSNLVERSIFGPFNFCFHYEHHRFMTIPYYRVGRIRKILRDAWDYDECVLQRSYMGRYFQILRDLRALSRSSRVV
jgi:fatty acid desaturase